MNHRATVVSVREYHAGDRLNRLIMSGRPLPFIYVGRSVGLLDGHPLANPFRVGRKAHRAARLACIRRYEEWLDSQEDNLQEIETLAHQIRQTGKPLACWCGFWPKEEDLVCHAVLLAKRVNVILEASP